MSNTDNILKSLRESSDTSVEQKIEIARLQFENDRLDVDKAKSKNEQRFFNKHFAVSLTAIISLGAVLVSLAQVWTATIQKDKEMEVARIQKEKELESVRSQQNHQRKLDMAKFVLDHGDELLGTNSTQRLLTTRVMLVTFPPEFSAPILDDLILVTESPQIKQEFQNVQRTILSNIKEKKDIQTTGKSYADGFPPDILRYFKAGTLEKALDDLAQPANTKASPTPTPNQSNSSKSSQICPAFPIC